MLNEIKHHVKSAIKVIEAAVELITDPNTDSKHHQEILDSIILKTKDIEESMNVLIAKIETNETQRSQ